MSFLTLELAIHFLKALNLRFISTIDFRKCQREIAGSLIDFSNCWCEQEHVDPDALKELEE